MAELVMCAVVALFELFLTGSIGMNGVVGPSISALPLVWRSCEHLLLCQCVGRDLRAAVDCVEAVVPDTALGIFQEFAGAHLPCSLRDAGPFAATLLSEI